MEKTSTTKKYILLFNSSNWLHAILQYGIQRKVNGKSAAA